MKNLKYYIGIALIILVDSLHNIYFYDPRKYDIYFFYDHARFLDNILFDISRMFSFSLLSYWLIRMNRRIFEPFFILSLLIWVSYFTYYNQKTSLLLIPLYVILVIYYNRKTIKLYLKKKLKS